MVELVMFNIQRAITLKVGKPELRFLCSARRLIVLHICVKFHENISDGIRVMTRIRTMEALMNGRMDTQSFGGYNIIPSPLFVAGHKHASVTHRKCHNKIDLIK